MTPEDPFPSLVPLPAPAPQLADPLLPATPWRLLLAALAVALPILLSHVLLLPRWAPPTGLPPALGIAVGLTLTWGAGIAPALLAGFFLGILLGGIEGDYLSAFVIATASTAGASLAGHTLRTLARDISPVSLRGILTVTGWGSIIAACMVSAATLPQAPPGDTLNHLLGQFFRLSCGILVFTPCTLAWLNRRPDPGQRMAENGLFVVSVTTASVLAFASGFAHPGWNLLPALALFPLLTWGSLRLPPHMARTAVAAVSAAAVIATSASLGPFSEHFGATLVPLFAYCAALSLTALPGGCRPEISSPRPDSPFAPGSFSTGSVPDGSRPASPSMARIRDFLDAAPMAGALRNHSGAILYANGACQAMFANRTSDLCGADVTRFFAVPADYRSMLDLLERNGRVDGYEYRLQKIDGQQRWVQEWWIPIIVDQSSLVLAWSVDISERKRAEEQLRNNERRLRAILDDSPLAVIISRPGGRIIYANPKAAGILGLPRALLIGSDARAFYVDPEQRHHLARILKSGGSVVNEETVLRSADGVNHTCVFSLLQVEFDGAPGYLAWSLDITARKTVEEQLRTSERRFRAILEASPLAMAVISRRGKVRYANPVLLSMLGVDSTADIKSPRDFLCDRSLANDLLHRLVSGQRPRGVEAEIARTDGSRLWALLSFEAGIFEGQPAAFMWAADISDRKRNETDLTRNRDELAQAVQTATRELEVVNRHLSRELEERKKAEENIRRSEIYLRTILDTVADGIITIDQGGSIEDFNPAAEVIFGYRRQDVVGRNVALLMPSPERETHDNFLMRYRNTGTSKVIGHRREVTGCRSDGSAFPLDLAVSAADVGDRMVYTGVLRDITEQKQAELALRLAKEEAEIANRSKSDFLANMSHELRTPLNAIIGFSEMILAEVMGPVGSERYREYISDIHQSGRHLLDVINDILDIARIEAGQMALHEEDVDLEQAIQAALKLVSPRAMGARQTLECHIPDTLPHLWGDARRIKQMILNLLANAVKFTPENGTISVTACSLQNGDDGLAITITDSGIGMTEEQAANVIKPFVQVDSGLSRKFDGTGLGLPLVAGMASLHGGKLVLDSTLGVGTTATVSFPASRVIRS